MEILEAPEPLQRQECQGLAPKAEKDSDQESRGGWAGEAGLGASAEQAPRGQSPFLAGGGGGKEPRGRTGGRGCVSEDPGRSQEEKRSPPGKETDSSPGKSEKR